MSDAVAIVSVAASGAVGLGGLAATAWGATSDRRWKSREERAVDARKVLADGGEALTELTWKLQTIRKKQLTRSVTDTDLKEVEEILGQRALRVTAQIALRFGVDAPVTQAFTGWSNALRDVLLALQEGGPNGAQYAAAWQEVVETEKPTSPGQHNSWHDRRGSNRRQGPCRLRAGSGEQAVIRRGPITKKTAK